MNHKNLYRISFVISLLLLITQGCGSSNKDLEPTSTAVPAITATVKPFHIESGSFEFEGEEREYMIFIPDTYSESQKFPLVIYLHSLGWTPQKDMEVTQLNQVADNNEFMVVYPSAIGLNWNSGIGDRVGWKTPDVNDVGFIDELIDTLSTSYSIDLDRIYATGWSNGGFMAYKLACQLSLRIAAVASVGGVLSTGTLSDCNPLRPVPILHIHGTRDSTVPMDGYKGWNSVDETISYWTTFNNCVKTETTTLEDLDQTDDLMVEKISYSNCTNNSNVIYLKRIGYGHLWPDASLGLIASEEVWNFFKDYQLTSTSN